MNSLGISYSDVSKFTGKLVYLHNGEDIGSGAFELSEKAEIRILLPRAMGVVSAYAVIYTESFCKIGEFGCEIIDSDLKDDTYKLNIPDFGKGLYFFSLVFNTAGGRFYGMKGKGREVYLAEREEGVHFQFSIVDFKYKGIEKHNGGVIYHIFVDRFSRGGNVKIRQDAVMIDDWENAIPEYPPYPGAHLENNTFFGGTLYGVIEKLDYIRSLGTTLIYLSPIFEAYSNHKYDTGDYMKVDEMFGSDEALALLIIEAKKRGIGIILDGVFNHTGADSVYFNKNGRYKTLGAYQSTESPYFKWYDFQSYPNKYTSWWGIEILPRINPDIKECGDFIAGECGVIEKYSKMGIYGFRLDVADELSDSFIAKIKSRLCKNDESAILYGEVWEDASNKIAYNTRKHYYLGDELDGVMNYPLRTGIIDFLKNKDKSKLEYALYDCIFNAPKRISDMQMNLLGTHDTERIISVLGDNEHWENMSNDVLAHRRLGEKERLAAINLLKMAYTILATVPGIPTIFYGDEAGLEGYRDPFNRRPYPWLGASEEIRNHYRRIGEIRNSYDVYKDGVFKVIKIENDLLIFSRSVGKEDFITVINNSEKQRCLIAGSVSHSLLDGLKKKKFGILPYTSYIIKTASYKNIEII